MLRKLQGRGFTQEQISGFHLRAVKYYGSSNKMICQMRDHAIGVKRHEFLAQMAERYWEYVRSRQQYNLWLEWQNYPLKQCSVVVQFYAFRPLVHDHLRSGQWLK